MLENIDQFHFLRPAWFLALLPIALLLIGLWFSQTAAQKWKQFISPHLLPHLLDVTQIQQKRLPIAALCATWLIACITLAGPVWKKIPLPVERNSNALVICWDLSPSMLAEDIKPSRLVKAKLKIIDLLKTKKDGQVGLIAYSGEAYTVTPLTDDFQTIINLLPALSPTTLPTVGSNPEMAIQQAGQLLKDAGITKGQILLLTDEISTDAMEYLTDQLQGSSNQLTIWGIGTAQGAPIPLPDGGFAKDGSGIVVAKLNEKEMQDFSSKVGAFYVPLVSGDSDVYTIDQITNPQTKQTKKTERTIEQWFEHGQYLILLLLPFAAFVFRRGVIFSLMFVPFLFTENAEALQWNDLWQTQDQQAQQALDKGEENAALKFSTPQKRGVELYKQNQFEPAAEQFAQGERAQDAYNLGNALVHSGAYDDAIKAYEKALSKQPDLSAAKDNLEIAEQLAELAKKNQQQQDNKNQDGDQKQDDQQKQDGDQQDQQDGENKDGKQNEKTSDQNQENQQDQKQGQSNSSDSEDKNDDSKMADAQDKKDQANPEDNPFATNKDDQDASKNEEAQTSSPQSVAQQQSSSSATQEEEEKQQIANAAQVEQQKELTEEEQMLEQWLRKVPDDPSGLMRNKFKYQYMQRRQSLGEQFSPQQKQAQKRW